MICCAIKITTGNLPIPYCTVKMVTGSSPMLYSVVKIVTENFSMLYCLVKIVTGNFCLFYCCKTDKNIKRDKNVLRCKFFVCFWGLMSSFLKYKIFFKTMFFHFLNSESSISRNIISFFGVPFSQNIRNVFRGFRFVKYKRFLRLGLISAEFTFRKHSNYFRANFLQKIWGWSQEAQGKLY